jgi:POT family proton-dependent oligopeptide transporter
VCGSFEFKWGFLAAGLGMLLGLLAFVLGQKKYLISEEGKELLELYQEGKSIANSVYFVIGVFMVMYKFLYLDL